MSTNAIPETLKAVLMCDRCKWVTRHDFAHSRVANTADTAWRLMFKCATCGSVRVWGFSLARPTHGGIAPFEPTIAMTSFAARAIA